MAPPLYDLTELQRHANRLFGFSAQQTLDVAQALYERYKLISYPRTDSRHLSQDAAVTLPRIVKAIAAPYQAHLAPGTGERPLGRRFVDDGKVTDHHAIIPTTTSPENANLTSEEGKIYDLVCRRLLSLARRSHLVSYSRNYGHPEQRCRRSLSHIGHRGTAGGLEGAGYRHGQEARQRRGRRRGAEGRRGLAIRPQEGRSTGGRGRRGHSEEDATVGERQWRELYIAHGEQKRAQIEKMLRFADTNQCRMSTLVRHFGDLADGQTVCGICDFCDPAGCVAQRFRTAAGEEQATLFRVLAALRSGEQKSTGKLHAELFPGSEMSRDAFEDVLGAMARAGVARLSDAVFEKDGKKIPYRTVTLTPTGRAANKATPIEFIMKDTSASTTKRRRKKKTPTSPKRKINIALKAGPKMKRTPAGSPVEEALRTLRLLEARRRGVPAFRIFNDQTLRAIAQMRPAKAAELIAIPGIGVSAVEKYGRQIYRICQAPGASHT